MKIVVLDTNVLLDLFVFNDFRAIHLKQALKENRLDAVACSQTLEEFMDVLARPLFCLDQSMQNQLISEWRSITRMIEDHQIMKAPWQCGDEDDQIFLDLAYTCRPCTLFSKDNEVLKIAKRAQAESIVISSDYSAL